MKLSTLLAAAALLLACGDDASPGADAQPADVIGDTAADQIAPDVETPEVSPDAPDPTDGSRPAPTLSAPALSSTSVCAGAEVPIPFTLSGGDGGTYRVHAELSDTDGDFANPTRIGSLSVSADATLTATIPAGTRAGLGYRVRLVIDESDDVDVEPLLVGGTLEVLGVPEITLLASPGAVLVGDPVRFVDDTADIASRTWTFPEDASLASSTDRIVDLTFAAPGTKTVRYDAVTSAGCAISRTLSSRFDSVEVLSCAPTIPEDARVYDASTPGANEFGGGYGGWICGGGDLSAAGGNVTIFVEPGATFHFTGGGLYTIFVRDGGTFVGGSGGQATLVLEPGAQVAQPHSNQRILECPTLAFDYASAPTGGCVPPGTNPGAVTATIGAIGAGPHCPGAPLQVPLTLAGAVGASNHVIAQLSDKDGSFERLTHVATVPATASGNIDLTLPAELEAGDDYRMRLVTSHPPTVGEPGASFSVYATTRAEIGMTQTKALVGQTVTFTNESEAHLAASWDFGEGASPATSTAADGVTSYATPGWKVVTLTITDANGCASSARLEQDPEIFGSGFEVLTCEVEVPTNAAVLAPGIHDEFGGTEPLWVCGGAQASLFGGARVVVVEEHGVFDFQGGGIHTFYARAGAIVGGAFGGVSTLVYETGAFVAEGDRFTNLLECPTLTVRTASAPSPGCAPFDPPPHAISVGAIDPALICLDEGLRVPVTTQGIFRLDNAFRLEASSASGSFDEPVEIGGARSISDGALYGRFRADTFSPGAGYRVRVTSDEPPIVSAPSATVLTLEATPEVRLEGPWFTEPSVPFVFQNTTAGEPAFAWTVDDVLVSTERSPTFTFTAHRRYDIQLTATTPAGCEDDRHRSVKVVSCAPPIPTTATVVTGTLPSFFGGLQRLWVCDGGQAEGGAGDYDIFVESGGSFRFTGGGIYSVYVKAGGTFHGGFGGIISVYAEPGANLNLSGSETLVKTCDSLAFDSSAAPPSGCQ